MTKSEYDKALTACSEEISRFTEKDFKDIEKACAKTKKRKRIGFKGFKLIVKVGKRLGFWRSKPIIIEFDREGEEIYELPIERE